MQDINGLTPVQSAINGGHWEVVKIFALFDDNQEAKEALGWIFNEEIINVFNDNDNQNEKNVDNKRKRENNANEGEEITDAKKFKLEDKQQLQNNNDNKDDDKDAAMKS